MTTTIRWPAELPQNQLIGVEEQDGDSVLRSDMDAGPPSRRNRFTGTVTKVKTRLVLIGAQKIAFDEFFRDTLHNGALSFRWTHPTTDVEVSFAFVGPVQWSMTKGGPPDRRLWEGRAELEIQP